MGPSPQFSEQMVTETEGSEFIPFKNHVTENVVSTKYGDYIQVFKLQGASHESADNSDLNSWYIQLNNFFKNTGSPNVAIWTHTVRRKITVFPGGEFAEGFCKQLNEKYRKVFDNKKLFVNELYLTLVYRPEPAKALKILGGVGKKSHETLKQERLDHLESLRELTSNAFSSLAQYEPRALGLYEHRGIMFSEIEEFLAFLVNGKWERRSLVRGEMRDHLTRARPRFGKGGLMELRGPSESTFGAALVIENYPNEVGPGLLNGLLSMPFEYVLTQSFTFLSKPVAKRRLKEQQNRMIAAGDVAESQIADISDALDDLESNVFAFGKHHLSLMIYNPDLNELNNNISMAGSELSDAGMKWGREDLGIGGCFYSQLPGNFTYRVRTGDITTRNLAGFASLHNYPSGRIDGTQWGDAVTMFETTSGAPYFFSFHKAEGQNKPTLDHKELANAIIIGRSGGGKTVLQGFLLSELQKFASGKPSAGVPANKMSSVVFDKDLGLSIAIRRMGGRYYPIKSGVPSGWNPMQCDPSPKNIMFLEKLIKRLVYRESIPLTPRQEKQLVSAIEGVLEAPLELRRLSALLQYLDRSEIDGLYSRLERWCEGGALGWLFDNPTDTMILSECPILGFDVTEFLDDAETRAATIMYLFHRIDTLIDGRRIPIFMDEFANLLRDPEFVELVKNKLVTIRKQDGFLVMGTQYPQQVINSPVSAAIIEQTATQIFLPNPKADPKDYIDGFKLTHREYQLIKEELHPSSRCFLIKQNGNSVVARLNLEGFGDELAIISANTSTAMLVERIISEHGEDPEIWAPIFHRIRKGETE